MAFDTQAFIGEILKDVQVDEAAKQTLAAIASNPTVAKRLEEGYLRQNDYSRLANEYKEKIQGAQTYWDGLARWKQEEEARLEQERAALKGGSPSPENTDPNKEFNDKLQKLATESLSYMNTLSTLQMKHFKEFNEILDPNELVKTATADRVSIDIAYDRLVAPKRNEIQQKDFQRQLDEARKQGAEEALKNVQIPVAETSFNVTGMPHALDRFEKKDQAPEYGAMAAVKAFSQASRSGNQLTSV